MVQSDKTASERLEEIEGLVVVILDGHGTRKKVESLRRFLQEHHPDCAFYTCTCGHTIAKNFLGLLDGSVQRRDLVRR